MVLNDLKLSKRRLVRSHPHTHKSFLLRRFVTLRVHPRTSRSSERLRIATLTIRELLHGRPRIATQLPLENLRGVSAEKGKFSVSCTVYTLTDIFLRSQEQKQQKTGLLRNSRGSCCVKLMMVASLLVCVVEWNAFQKISLPATHL